MDEVMKDKLRKKEIPTYSRRNKVPVPPPQVVKKGVPLLPPASKEVPPPLVSCVLP
jgi:hypothetical protein